MSHRAERTARGIPGARELARSLLRVVGMTAVVDTTNWKAILKVASSLVAQVDGHVRASAIVHAIHELVPCDSVTLLRLDGDALVAIASAGPRAGQQADARYSLAEHPRLAQFVRASGPMRIADASERELLEIGCPLAMDGTVFGVLVFHSRNPQLLATIPDAELATIASFTAAAVRATDLMAQLERGTQHAVDAESLPSSVTHLKRQRLLEAIAAADGNWAKAARMLSIDRSNFHRLARRLGIVRARENGAETASP